MTRLKTGHRCCHSRLARHDRFDSSALRAFPRKGPPCGNQRVIHIDGSLGEFSGLPGRRLCWVTCWWIRRCSIFPGSLGQNGSVAIESNFRGRSRNRTTFKVMSEIKKSRFCNFPNLKTFRYRLYIIGSKQPAPGCKGVCEGNAALHLLPVYPVIGNGTVYAASERGMGCQGGNDRTRLTGTKECMGV